MASVLEILQNMSDRVSALISNLPFITPNPDIIDIPYILTSLEERATKIDPLTIAPANTPLTYSPESIIDRGISLIQNTQPFINAPSSTIDRETPLLQEPDLPNMLPQQGSPISSNIMQYTYYPLYNSIIITFSNMVDYQYWDVTQAEFLSIIQGNASCVTEGKNQFGQWYIGKTPSVGAAVYRFLVQANKPWRRL